MAAYKRMNQENHHLKLELSKCESAINDLKIKIYDVDNKNWIINNKDSRYQKLQDKKRECEMAINLEKNKLRDESKIKNLKP